MSLTEAAKLESGGTSGSMEPTLTGSRTSRRIPLSRKPWHGGERVLEDDRSMGPGPGVLACSLPCRSVTVTVKSVKAARTLPVGWTGIGGA